VIRTETASGWRKLAAGLYPFYRRQPGVQAQAKKRKAARVLPAQRLYNPQ